MELCVTEGRWGGASGETFVEERKEVLMEFWDFEVVGEYLIRT